MAKALYFIGVVLLAMWCWNVVSTMPALIDLMEARVERKREKRQAEELKRKEQIWYDNLAQEQRAYLASLDRAKYTTTGMTDVQCPPEWQEGISWPR